MSGVIEMGVVVIRSGIEAIAYDGGRIIECSFVHVGYWDIGIGTQE